MQEDISQKPIVSNKKVYIINDSEKMTKESQNCLLKTLEEPPEYVVIILVTSNDSKLLTTVKSRCTKVFFNPLTIENLKEYMNSKYESIEDSLLSFADGSIGRAIDLQENKDIYMQINDLLNSINKMDLVSLLNKIDIIYKQKEKINDILDYINVYLFKLNEINCVKYIEDTKKRLSASNNFDMAIDYLFIRIWEEMN